jgi:hypothetical protein
MGSIANKANDPVLKAAIEDTKLKVQGLIGDLARAVPMYEKNKTAVLAASIKEASKEQPEVPAVATAQPLQQTPAPTLDDQTLTESVVGKTGKFMMEGWLIEKPEMSSSIEATPMDIRKMSGLFSVMPKSASGCSDVRVIIQLARPGVSVRYANQLGNDEKEITDKESSSIFWKGAIEDIRNEVIRRLKLAKS